MTAVKLNFLTLPSMQTSLTVLIPTVAFLFLVSAQYKRSQYLKRFRLPPGPPEKPLIGNLLDFDLRAIGIRFTEYKSIYGVFSFSTPLKLKKTMID